MAEIAFSLHNAAAVVTPGTAVDLPRNAEYVLIELTGPFVGTLEFEATAGSVWVPVWAEAVSTGGPAVQKLNELSATSALYRIKVAGLDQLRVNITAHTSGSVTATALSTSSARGLEVLECTFTRPADVLAYAARDVVGASPQTLAGAGAAGFIVGAIVLDSANQTTDPTLELWIFDTAPAAQADNVAFAPSDAEVQRLVAVIPLGAADTFAGDAAVTGNLALQAASGLRRPYKSSSATHALHAVLVVTNAYTPVASETFKVRVFVERD